MLPNACIFKKEKESRSHGRNYEEKVTEMDK